jgi:hypothetical protein
MELVTDSYNGNYPKYFNPFRIFLYLDTHEFQINLTMVFHYALLL